MANSNSHLGIRIYYWIRLSDRQIQDDEMHEEGARAWCSLAADQTV